MSVEEKRARISSRVRQALGESGIDFSTLQRAQVDNLVNHIADNMLLEFDSLLGGMASPAQPERTQQPAAAPAATGGSQEQVLWEGRPFLSIGERYVITTERVRMITGLIGKDHEDIELVRVQDVDHTQGISERILNIGDVTLRTADRSQPDAVLRNVTNPEEVHEILRRAVIEARKKYPFIFEQNL